MNVFELFAKLGLDSSEYDEGLDNAESKGSKFGEGLKKAAGVTAGAIATTTAATIAGAKAFVDGVSSVASYGDNIDKMSQKMNMSAEAYQEWDFIMQHAGTTIGTMQSGIKTLSNAAETGNEAFEKLGISQEQIASMSGEELFASTITALQGVEDETERTYLAGQLLGRGATELGALLNMSADEVSEMRVQAHELGGVMSDESVKAAAGFQDSLQNVQTSLTGMKNSMLSDFLPAFSTTMDGLANIFSGSDMEGGLTQIEEGISTLADNLISKAPQIFEIGGSILQALLSSITKNLPVLLEAAVPIVMELVTGIVENLPAVMTAAISLISSIVEGISNNLPKILTAAQQVILALANALAKNAPTIIPTIVQLIMTIVTTLTNPEFLVPLIQAGLEIIMGLIQGIVSAIPLIIENLPVIIENIVNVLLEGLPLILEAGIEIFNSLIEALPVIMASLEQVLPTVIDLIVKLIIDGLPMVLQGAIQLLMAIIQALPTILSALVVNIPQIIITIVNTLISHLPELLQGAIMMFLEIIKAIPTLIVELAKNIPSIITAIVEGLTAGISQISSVGENLIMGLWNGISNMSSWIGDKIKGFGEGVVNGLKDFFGIASPSKLFRDQIGKNLALGLGEGFSNEMDDVGDEMIKKAGDISDDLSDSLAFDGIASSGAVNMNSYTRAANGIRVNSASNETAIIDKIDEYIGRRMQNLELVVPVYIGGKKIDQQIVTSNARTAVVSGGR